MLAAAWGLAIALAAPASPAEIHPGMGMLARLSQDARPVAGSSEAPAPRPVLPAAGIRPPSTLDMVRSSRGAKIASITTALAVQGAMIVYGLLSLREQQRDARRLREAFPTFNPYPR